MGRRNHNITTEKIWKTAISIRLSKEDGNNESYSIKGQRQTIQYYIETSDELFEVVDEFIDDGASGSDTEREDFQRMLKLIEEGKINCVIVCDLSRLSRNYAETRYAFGAIFRFKKCKIY